MKNKGLYYILIVLSIILLIVSIWLFNDTKFIAPIMILESIYLFLGAIIKLCKTSNKLKDKLICTLDLLFWLP